MRSSVVLAFVIAAATSSAYAENARIVLPTAGRLIAPSALAPLLIKPCSRRGAVGAESFWEPTEAQLNVLEAKLIAFLKSQPSDVSPPARTSYHRQYAGFVKAGRRYIYGSFYAARGKMTQAERDRPIGVCDGGPAFWGVVYDLESGEFSDLALNPVI